MLKRLTKQEVLDQLAAIRRMAAGDGQAGSWRARIPRAYEKPATDVVHDVVTVGDTVHLCPVRAEGDIVRKLLSLVTDKDLGDMTLDEVQHELASSAADEIVIGWPDGHLSCVCRVIAMTAGDEGGFVFLFPGPIDMDKVNEEIEEYRRTHGCPDPGLDCEGCPRLMGCEILVGAENESKAKREGTA